MDHYVAVLGADEEYGEIEARSHSLEWDKKNLCQQLVRRLGLTARRNEPKKVTVSVFRLRIIEGKMERRGAGNYDIDLPFAKMTRAEYVEVMQQTLQEIPAEFWLFVREFAYERGHSAGYEEVISIAQAVVRGLKPCIEAFRHGQLSATQTETV